MRLCHRFAPSTAWEQDSHLNEEVLFDYPVDLGSTLSDRSSDPIIVDTWGTGQQYHKSIANLIFDSENAVSADNIALDAR